MVDASLHDGSWRLRGTARRAAGAATGALVGAALAAAAIDHALGTSSDWLLLQNWSLVPHGLAIVGLAYVGKVRGSRAATITAGLLVLVFVEEAFHVLNPLAALHLDVTNWLLRESGLGEVAGLGIVSFYALVAFVGLGVLAVAYREAAVGEKRVVRNIALLLVLGGFFGGPISTAALVDNSRGWVFVEEFGEALTYALLAGYVVGVMSMTGVFRRTQTEHLATRLRP